MKKSAKKNNMKLIELTTYAYEHLNQDDIEALESLIGTECILTNDCDMYMMEDGELCHTEFLIFE